MYILDLLSVLVVQELGKVKSKRPNNDNAKTINIMSEGIKRIDNYLAKT